MTGYAREEGFNCPNDNDLNIKNGNLPIHELIEMDEPSSKNPLIIYPDQGGITFNEKTQKGVAGTLNLGTHKSYLEATAQDNGEELVRFFLTILTFIYWFLFSCVFYVYHSEELKNIFDSPEKVNPYSMPSSCAIGMLVYALFIWGSSRFLKMKVD